MNDSSWLDELEGQGAEHRLDQANRMSEAFHGADSISLFCERLKIERNQLNAMVDRTVDGSRYNVQILAFRSSARDARTSASFSEGSDPQSVGELRASQTNIKN